MNRGTPLMTPEEVQRTMDFILRSQANSVIRMDRLEEAQKKFDRKMQTQSKKTDAQIKKTDTQIKKTNRQIKELQALVDSLVGDVRDLAKSSRNTIRRTRALEESDRRTEQAITLLSQLAHANSRRIDRIERNGR
jgi:septal ring factor EnvC (AmiA/AmiB activator)